MLPNEWVMYKKAERQEKAERKREREREREVRD
jgi:hypothetical protein